MKILIIHDEDLTTDTNGKALEDVELADMRLGRHGVLHKDGVLILGPPGHYNIMGWADRIILVRDPHFVVLKDRNGPRGGVRPLNELPLFLASTK